MYGKAVLADEINKIVSEELSSFIRDNNLKILGEPISDTSDEKKADLDKDEILAFYFDVALTPEFDLILDKNTELTYYRVKLEDDLWRSSSMPTDRITVPMYPSMEKMEKRKIQTCSRGRSRKWKRAGIKKTGR